MKKKIAAVFLVLAMLVNLSFTSIAEETKILYISAEEYNADTLGCMIKMVKVPNGCRDKFPYISRYDNYATHMIIMHAFQLIEIDETHLIDGACAHMTNTGQPQKPEYYEYILAYDSTKAAADAAQSLQGREGVDFAEQDYMVYLLDSVPFKDVCARDWFIDGVSYLYGKNIIAGLDETTFGPSEALYRTQLAQMLYRIEGSPEVEYKDYYSDVEADKWYTDAVIWAYEEGIMTGYTDGSFGIYDVLTREQLCAVLYRSFNQKGSVGFNYTTEYHIDSFRDQESVSDFALEAMTWAVKKGFITGDSGKLNPGNACNRAMGAQILYKFIANKDVNAD